MTTRTVFRDNRTNRITRGCVSTPVASKFVLADADVIDFRGASGAQLLVPAGTQSQTLTVHVSDTETGTYLPLSDNAGDAVTIAIEASKAYDLPEAIYASAFVKFKGEDTKDFTGTLVCKG